MKKLNEFLFTWWQKLISKKVITAEEAYNVSKFGNTENKTKRTKRVIEDINKLIQYKIQIRKFSLIYDLDEEDVDAQDVIEYFEELGYSVVLLDSKLNDKIIGEHIFITWLKNDI